MIFSETFSTRRILITGNTGFKGSWMTLWLHELGANICGYSDRELPEPSHYNLLNLKQEIRQEFGDICDACRLRQTIEDFKPEVIFHFAAQALVRSSYHDPLTTIKSNTLGTATLLDVIKDISSVKALVLITSDKVYANMEWNWGYRENDRLGGYDPYSASKASCRIVNFVILK